MTRSELIDRFFQALGIIVIAAVILLVGVAYVWDTVGVRKMQALPEPTPGTRPAMPGSLPQR